MENKLVAYYYGKVFIQFNSSLQSIIGYIMEERHGRWSILLKDNSIITSQTVLYDNKMGEYSFPKTQNSQKGYFNITQYWPIQVLIYAQGES